MTDAMTDAATSPLPASPGAADAEGAGGASRRARTIIASGLAAGFALMFAAGAIMWAQFGPTMFVDLATAILTCF